MNKQVLIPEETAIQLLHVLNEFKLIYQEQTLGNTKQVSENYLSEKQAASFLNCSVSKIQTFRKKGAIEYFKFGKRIFYKEQTLRQFVDANSFYAEGTQILNIQNNG